MCVVVASTVQPLRLLAIVNKKRVSLSLNLLRWLQSGESQAIPLASGSRPLAVLCSFGLLRRGAGRAAVGNRDAQFPLAWVCAQLKMRYGNGGHAAFV